MRDNHENQEQEEKKMKFRWKNKLKLKQAWVGLASVCVAMVLAVALIIAFAGQEQPAIDAGNLESSTPVNGDNGSNEGNEGVQKPVEEDLGMGMPITMVSVSNDFGFFYNQTIDCYYHHDGVDFLADEGTAVLAAEDGVVESIYSGDILKGTEVVLDHGNGLKTVYRFVAAAEGLAVGDEVKQGDLIATVSEATGDEYKDGTHLHFEITENGMTVDPTAYLSFGEK